MYHKKLNKINYKCARACAYMDVYLYGAVDSATFCDLTENLILNKKLSVNMPR